MKYLFRFLLVLIPFSSISQKNTYNTKFDTVGEVKISGGKVTILKADKVVNENKYDSIFWTNYLYRPKDSFGLYTFVYEFAPRFVLSSFKVNITINFDKPFVPWTVEDPPPPRNVIIWSHENRNFVAAAWDGDEDIARINSSDFKSIHVRGVINGDYLIIAIKSKEELHAEIKGVDGNLCPKYPPTPPLN